MASAVNDPPETITVVPRAPRDQSFLTTDWLEMIKHAHEVPCMGKALGYGGVGGVFTGIVNRFLRSRT